VAAYRWIRDRKPFAGLLFAHQLGITLGQMVRDLELIASASLEGEWDNQIERLPL
jgi:hypothetical protein